MVLVKFADDSCFGQIFQRRDLNIARCPFIVRRWPTETTYESMDQSKLPLWIHLKNVPLEFHHERGIQYIMSSYATSLKIGLGINSRKVVRVLAEFHALVPVRRLIRLFGVENKMVEVMIDYEFVPSQCNCCGVFGHDMLRCSRAWNTHSVGRSS